MQKFSIVLFISLFVSPCPSFLVNSFVSRSITSNENKAYKKASYLKGVMDTIKATGFGVRIHYVDNAFFSEIDEYDITVIK